MARWFAKGKKMATMSHPAELNITIWRRGTISDTRLKRKIRVTAVRN
jgi:hypothetical protein